MASTYPENRKTIWPTDPGLNTTRERCQQKQRGSDSEALKTNRNVKTHVELLSSLGHSLQSLDISVVPEWMRNSSNTAEATAVSCRDKRFRGLGGVRGRIVGTLGDGRDRIWREEGKNQYLEMMSKELRLF